MQAYRVAESIGALREWSGSKALLIASRLAANLGATRLQRWLQLRALRANPRDNEAVYFARLGLHRRRRPVAAWRFVEKLGTLSGTPRERAELLSLRARIADDFRDFDASRRSSRFCNRARAAPRCAGGIAAIPRARAPDGAAV